MGFLRGLADDLGLGLGWSGLYFTIFLARWKGRTPGKRLFGLRVVRLNGEPLGWWPAFERFGGYAASLATGTLGFLQIFWDANRQGVHDKVVGTVVVLDSAVVHRALIQARRPGPAPAAPLTPPQSLPGTRAGRPTGRGGPPRAGPRRP
ncbi:MAG: RDD family protein [Gemmatimonadota bacterium]